ncbi:putative high-affinity glucose transporter [Aspergillus affinis]|uniref:putative high-affinity glucose transporter n=1 Tax=Aspergillus affinis TaxID=1070780 RepID=UPI0022FE04FE|nr:putative high-affinity glucose transporter [Aspergillus affinis]KAI9041219.1 putative high-affinity glucose transporter [Aspergillus affinis]
MELMTRILINGRFLSDKTSVGTGTGSAGIILGCIMAPVITSRFGRKMGFMALSCLMTVGVILESSALTSFWQLAVGRIVVYSGIGLASNVVPTYLSQCSLQRVRGAFLSLYSFFTSFGVFIATLVDRDLLPTIRPSWLSTRLPVPPRAPRYLVYRGKFAEAEAVMKKLSNRPETISQEIEMLRVQIDEQRELHKATTVLDCFKGTNLRRTVAAMGVQILQQAQGVSFIQNFIVTFMQQMGFPDPLQTNVLVTGCSFVCHFITFITFDKLGRRNSLFLGSVGLAATMLGTGGAIESSPMVADLSSQAKAPVPRC